MNRLPRLVRLFLPFLLAPGCVSGWPRPTDLESEPERHLARERAKASLQDRTSPPVDRERAAELLGLLGDPCLGCVSVLGGVLSNPEEPDRLRAWSAWALGRLGEPATLDALVSGLSARVGPRASEYLVDALWSKHELIFGDPELQADLAEGLNTFLAQSGEKASSSALALQARVATLPVSLRVLDRALGNWLEAKDARAAANLTRATGSVFRRLRESRHDRSSRPEQAWVELREAINLLQRVSLVADTRVCHSVWATLGHRADEAMVARAAAEAFFGAHAPVAGRPTVREHASDRFLGAYLGERVLLSRPSVRAALRDDVLLREHSPEVLRMLADLARQQELDLVRELAP